MRLLLIRHGQTPNNVAGAVDTAFPGAGLTPLGQAQARAVPPALTDEDVAAVYASRLVRTQLTAAPLAQQRGFEVDVRPGFEEISAGALEMRTDTDSVHAYAACCVSWMAGDLHVAMPGGPDGHAFLARYDAALSAVAERHGRDDTVAVFSHGAAMRVWTSLRAGLDLDTAAELRIFNTGMAVLDGDPADGWQLLHWNTEPLGGLELEDAAAHDVTGESAEEALHEDAPR